MLCCLQSLKMLYFPGVLRLQGLSILQFAGFSACKRSKCFNFQGWLKCNYFVRVCACRNSKCFNFQDLAHAGVQIGMLRCSTCFTCQGCAHERAPNAARSASLSRDFVHAGVPHASFARDSNVQTSPKFACIIGAPVGFTGLVPKTAILGNF